MTSAILSDPLSLNMRWDMPFDLAVSWHIPTHVQLKGSESWIAEVTVYGYIRLFNDSL